MAFGIEGGYMRPLLEHADVYDPVLAKGFKRQVDTLAISANIDLESNRAPIISRDPTGGHRNVLLPAPEEGLAFTISNPSSTNNLLVRHFTHDEEEEEDVEATLRTLTPGQTMEFIAVKGEWRVVNGGTFFVGEEEEEEEEEG